MYPLVLLLHVLEGSRSLHVFSGGSQFSVLFTELKSPYCLDVHEYCVTEHMQSFCMYMYMYVHAFDDITDTVISCTTCMGYLLHN